MSLQRRPTVKDIVLGEALLRPVPERRSSDVAVGLQLRAGDQPLSEVARDFGVSEETLRDWIRRAGVG